MFETVSWISQTFWAASRMHKNEIYGWSSIESYKQIDGFWPNAHFHRRVGNDGFFDILRNSSETSWNRKNSMDGFYFPNSTGLSLGNQVDGLPGALHTEAVAGPP